MEITFEDEVGKEDEPLWQEHAERRRAKGELHST